MEGLSFLHLKNIWNIKNEVQSRKPRYTLGPLTFIQRPYHGPLVEFCVALGLPSKFVTGLMPTCYFDAILFMWVLHNKSYSVKGCETWKLHGLLVLYWTHLFEVGLMQNLVDHIKLSITCHVGRHIRFASILMTLGISMLKNIFLLHTKCEHITLAICILNNIFPLHTKMQNCRLKHPNVLC